MVEFTVGEDDAEDPSEFVHIYERNEDGLQQRLITGSRDAPSVSEAADTFGYEAENLSWILSKVNESDGVEEALVPCVDCGDQLPVAHKIAARVEHDDLWVRCGSCSDKSSTDTEHTTE